MESSREGVQIKKRSNPGVFEEGTGSKHSNSGVPIEEGTGSKDVQEKWTTTRWETSQENEVSWKPREANGSVKLEYL